MKLNEKIQTHSKRKFLKMVKMNLTKQISNET